MWGGESNSFDLWHTAKERADEQQSTGDSEEAFTLLPVLCRAKTKPASSGKCGRGSLVYI